MCSISSKCSRIEENQINELNSLGGHKKWAYYKNMKK